jgi:hypothetical protein
MHAFGIERKALLIADMLSEYDNQLLHTPRDSWALIDLLGPRV